MLPEFLDRLIAVLLPKRCGFCDAVVEYDSYWCGKCALPRREEPCSLPGDVSGSIAASLSPFIYQEQTKRAVVMLKEKPDRRIARFLAEWMKAELEREPRLPQVDFIVAVPQSEAKRQLLGYNHALLLAQELALATGIPLREGLLRRSEDSRPQHELDAAGRIFNAEHSYRGTGEELGGQHILLVDDVLTTGATAAACARRLQEAGAGRITVIAATVVYKIA